MSKRGIEMSPEANILCILYIFLLFMEFVASSCPVLIPTLKIPFGERVTKIPYTSVWISCYDLPHGYLHAQFSSVLSLSRARLFVTPWTTAHQASLSITISWSSLRLMSIQAVMPSSHLILWSSPSPPAPNPSQHQSLFQWVNSSHEVAKVLEFQL